MRLQGEPPLPTYSMNEEIPQLPNYDETSLDAAFATLADEVRGETGCRR